jgi:hypothetical protein
MLFARAKPTFAASGITWTPRKASSLSERVVGAGVVDDDDLVGPPPLLRQRFQALTEERAAIPVDNQHGDGHVVVI